MANKNIYDEELASYLRLIHERLHQLMDNKPGHGQMTLPPLLSTPEAMKLWQKAQEAGYIDMNYQPLISRTLSAILAFEMAKRLGIPNKWKTFEALWHRKNMRIDYNNALSQQQSYGFMEELKSVLS